MFRTKTESDFAWVQRQQKGSGYYGLVGMDWFGREGRKVVRVLPLFIMVPLAYVFVSVTYKLVQSGV